MATNRTVTVKPSGGDYRSLAEPTAIQTRTLSGDTDYNAMEYDPLTQQIAFYHGAGGSAANADSTLLFFLVS